MAASTTPQEVSARWFWEQYYRDRLVTCRRTNDGYEGAVYTDPSSGQGLLGLTRDMKLGPFRLSLQQLRDHDYFGDRRFFLIDSPPLANVPRDTAASVALVLDGAYPHRSAPPLGDDRLAEVFQQLIDDMRMSSPNEVTIIGLQQQIHERVDAYSDKHGQPLAALAWILGELRDPSSADALAAILRKSVHMRRARTTVTALAHEKAYEALWKINPKSKLAELHAMANEMTAAGQRNMAMLYARLLSTQQQLTREQLGDDYDDSDYWSRHLVTRTSEEWHTFDASAFYWEIRWLAAWRLSDRSIDALELLANDEVATVAAVAKRRLAP